jgi:hypothetical protein
VTSSALAVAVLVACGGKIASSAGDGGAAGSNVSEPAADPPVSGFDAAPPPPRFDAAPSCPPELPESGTSCADHRFAECQYEFRLDGGAACQVTCTCVVIPEEEWWRCTPC